MHDIFVSYASKDNERVFSIVDHLINAGINVWIDKKKISATSVYGLEITKGIQKSSIFMLMCSNASIHSKNVLQEILLAWDYNCSFLPVLLDKISYSDQIKFWLTGWQWIEAFNNTIENVISQIIDAVAINDIKNSRHDLTTLQKKRFKKDSLNQFTRISNNLNGLISAASFTDKIWPVPFESVNRDKLTNLSRGLGEPQFNVQHHFSIGSNVCVVIESDQDGYLTLIDIGPEGKIYCLCPSWFAPKTNITSGRIVLPLDNSIYKAFNVTGIPGREQILAIVTNVPLSLDWMTPSDKMPAKILNEEDIDYLLSLLSQMDKDSWLAISTYFDIF